MNLITTPNLAQELSESFLIVDTCALIDAIKTEDFLRLINEIKNKNHHGLFSIDAVKHEFLRGACTIEEYISYETFLKTLDISFMNDIEKKLDTDEAGRTFILAFNQYYRNKHSNKQPSHVDMLLLFATYFYTRTVKKVKLLTANHRDIPGFFQRTNIIAFEANNEIRTEALYEFNSDRFAQKLEILLRP